MMTLRTEALVYESISVKQLLRLQRHVCIYMNLCVCKYVCLYECLVHCVRIVCKCVCQIASWGQQAKQTHRDKPKTKGKKKMESS